MKKNVLIALFTVISIQSYSQITFDKGYIINEAGNVTSVYIRFNEMTDNPSQIQYKFTPDGEVNTSGLSSIKEFGIGDDYKFTRETVNIDRSSEDLNNLSRDRNPVFKEETLFLRNLIEGEYSLLSYRDGKILRFFVRKSNGELEQLIYKKYSTGDNIVRKNTRYKQQLMGLLKCDDISENNLNRLNYTRQNLIKIFQTYYTCKESKYKVYYSEQKGDINLMVKAGVNFTNFGMEQDIYNIVEEFKYEIDPRIGLELEYILPMANQKLALYMEPSFSMYKAEQEIIIATEGGGPSNPEGRGGYKALVNMDYKVLDLPLGIRYYMFLNRANTSKMFVNAGASLNMIFNSSKIITMSNNRDFNFNQSWQPTFFGGVGYRLKEKFSIEGRYYPVRPLTDNNGYKLHQNHSFAIVAGYTLF